jgi:hypothetical protein
MQLIDISPAMHKLQQRPASEIAKARIRLVIEAVFATLKRQMSLQDHLANTLPGLVARIAQRLLALTTRDLPQHPDLPPTTSTRRV